MDPKKNLEETSRWERTIPKNIFRGLTKLTVKSKSGRLLCVGELEVLVVCITATRVGVWIGIHIAAHVAVHIRTDRVAVHIDARAVHVLCHHVRVHGISIHRHWSRIGDSALHVTAHGSAVLINSRPISLRDPTYLPKEFFTAYHFFFAIPCGSDIG